MPLFMFLLIFVIIVVIGAVQAARRGGLGWISGTGIDLLQLTLSLTCLALAILILATIARFESDTNITVAGTALNIPLLAAPALLFIITILSLVRLIKSVNSVKGGES